MIPTPEDTVPVHDQAQAGQIALPPAAGQPAHSATTSPEAVGAALNTGQVGTPIATTGYAQTVAPQSDALAGLPEQQALTDLQRAEAALLQQQQRQEAPPSSPSAAGITAFAHVGMPVQFMPRAIAGNDAPEPLAATIVHVGEKGVCDLRISPRTQAPTYVEHGVPAFEKWMDAFYWNLIGGLEG